MGETFWPNNESPYEVNGEVREAAKDALIARDWKLTEWDKYHFSAEQVTFYTNLLNGERAQEQLVRSLNTDTFLGKKSAELIDSLRKEGRGR